MNIFLLHFFLFLLLTKCTLLPGVVRPNESYQINLAKWISIFLHFHYVSKGELLFNVSYRNVINKHCTYLYVTLLIHLFQCIQVMVYIMGLSGRTTYLMCAMVTCLAVYDFWLLKAYGYHFIGLKWLNAKTEDGKHELKLKYLDPVVGIYLKSFLYHFIFHMPLFTILNWLHYTGF